MSIFPCTANPQGVSDLLTALLDTISRVVDECRKLSDGDLLQGGTRPHGRRSARIGTRVGHQAVRRGASSGLRRQALWGRPCLRREIPALPLALRPRPIARVLSRHIRPFPRRPTLPESATAVHGRHPSQCSRRRRQLHRGAVVSGPLGLTRDVPQSWLTGLCTAVGQTPEPPVNHRK